MYTAPIQIKLLNGLDQHPHEIGIAIIDCFMKDVVALARQKVDIGLFVGLLHE